MSATDSPLAGAAAQAPRTEVDLAWRHFGAARSPEEYCRHWLALQCHAIGAVRDAVAVLQKPGTEAFAPLAAWPEERPAHSALGPVAERALREGRGIVQPRAAGEGAPGAEPKGFQIAYPIRLDGRVRGVVAVEIGWREAPQLQQAMRQLQWGSGWLEVLLRRHADPVEAARQRINLVLQFVSVFVERPAFREAATDLVTDVAARLGCDRVVLGLVHGDGVRVEAVSHSVQFDRRANLLNAISQAMTEALDQREPVVFPQEADARPVVALAHAELAQASGAGGILSAPLVTKEGRAVGALTLERAPGLRFDAPTVELVEALAAMLAPLVALRQTEQRSLAAHAASSAAGVWERLAGPRHGGFKLGALLVAALALFLALATGEYRVSAEARVEGEIQRALTAPFPGFVRESALRAGDTVKAGALLARLDDRDLRLERTRLEAQVEQYGRQYRDAMARRDRAQAGIVSAQSEGARAQLALVEEQLARTDIVAPFDGVLVSGDLTQSLGAPLERGQTLFEIAPLDAYRVVLEVDEHRIAELAPGQRGELVLSSMPGRQYPLTLGKITPVSTAREGRNYFRVEARLDEDPGLRLRPGMEGVAKVTVDERRLLWIWTHELAQWVRLKLWAWTP